MFDSGNVETFDMFPNWYWISELYFDLRLMITILCLCQKKILYFFKLHFFKGLLRPLGAFPFLIIPFLIIFLTTRNGVPIMSLWRYSENRKMCCLFLSQYSNISTQWLLHHCAFNLFNFSTMSLKTLGQFDCEDYYRLDLLHKA